MMNLQVKQKFAAYPDNVRIQLMKVRDIIFDIARLEQLGDIEETLKWGEPSYLVKGGSTIRMDWKPKFPDRVFVYFNCKTTLIETIKEIYGDLFVYEGNRAIVFDPAKTISLTELRHCLSLSLRYHKIKNLPLLGA